MHVHASMHTPGNEDHQQFSGLHDVCHAHCGNSFLPVTSVRAPTVAEGLYVILSGQHVSDGLKTRNETMICSLHEDGQWTCC